MNEDSFIRSKQQKNIIRIPNKNNKKQSPDVFRYELKAWRILPFFKIGNMDCKEKSKRRRGEEGKDSEKMIARK